VSGDRADLRTVTMGRANPRAVAMGLRGTGRERAVVHDAELLLPLAEEWDRELASADPLGFPGYAEQLAAAAGESIRTGLVESRGIRAVLVQSDFEVFGGTMGAVTGEKIVRAFRRAVDRRLPVVAVTRTGGARMQEGMASLIQMPRTATAVDEHSRSGLLSAIVYRSPTTGGVFASWASLLDLRAAEPHATMGFAGPRVVQQVTGEAPPAWSHTAENAHAAGLVDALVDRGDQLAWVNAVLGLADWPLILAGRPGADPGRIPPTAPAELPSSAQQAIRRARDRSRPSGLEWASALCSSWVELKGPDPAVRAGLARILDQRVIVVAMNRYADGAGAARPGPAAYRLARRAIGLADRLGLPLLTLVDTPGAEPGPGAEQAGIAGEIAATIAAMSRLRMPSVCICVGEGGSGGAMALAHADRLFMLPSSIFSVISPEGAAAILFHDPARADELAGPLKLTSAELIGLGIADGVLPELAADRTGCLRQAVTSAIAAAMPGDRDRRIAKATRSFITAGSAGPAEPVAHR
jgi:acetyl-CoA carboxylase alpha subunit/acetyl-CoA carboxylase beta subunit